MFVGLACFGLIWFCSLSCFFCGFRVVLLGGFEFACHLVYVACDFGFEFSVWGGLVYLEFWFWSL